MKTRIVWTSEERTSVVQRMVHLLNAVPVNYSKKGLVIAGCAALPEARHRSVFTNKELTDMNAQARSRAASSIKGVAAVPAPAAATAQPLQQVIKSELGAALEHLIDLVVDRVVARVQSRFVTEKAASTPEPAPVAVPSFDPALARANLAQRTALPNGGHRPRPGVLIIGLLGAQVSKVIEAYPHLDITHMTGEEGNTRPALLRAHTILMTKFINHNVQGKYRKAPNLHFCHGGVTELCRVLQAIGAKAVAA
jgi:hypothetical protein